MSAIMCRGGCAAFRMEDVNEWNNLNNQMLLGLESSICVHNGKLYAVQYGSPHRGALYEWDGISSWVLVAEEYSVDGYILTLCSYNGKLYGAGYAYFAAAGFLLEWNGTNAWVSVANRLPAPNNYSFINKLCVHENKLYGVLSKQLYGCKLVEWNGTNAWSIVASCPTGARDDMFALCSYNGKLYGATYLNDSGQSLLEWNGTDAWLVVAYGNYNIQCLFCFLTTSFMPVQMAAILCLNGMV